MPTWPALEANDEEYDINTNTDVVVEEDDQNLQSNLQTDINIPNDIEAQETVDMNMEAIVEEDDQLQTVDMNMEASVEEDDHHLQSVAVENDNQETGLAATVTHTATPLASANQLSTSPFHLQHESFLYKLFAIMKFAVDTDRTDVISWTSDGLAFIVHDNARFASEVLTKYFRSNKLLNFDKNLNAWRFISISPKKRWDIFGGGKSFAHPSF